MVYPCNFKSKLNLHKKHHYHSYSYNFFLSLQQLFQQHYIWSASATSVAVCRDCNNDVNAWRNGRLFYTVVSLPLSHSVDMAYLNTCANCSILFYESGASNFSGRVPNQRYTLWMSSELFLNLRTIAFKKTKDRHRKSSKI